MIRAFFTATKVEDAQSPYDTIHLKVFYPGVMSGNHQEKDLGIIPVNPEQSPFPVVIFFSGANCDAQLYQWLAVKLAERGLVVVIFNWIGESLPGIIGLTPGVDIATWYPEIYGTAPTASALPTLLTKLEQLQSEGILAGMLDLQRIVLGGHSVGGRIAIENANPSFFPQVVASFAYGAHSGGTVMLGYKAGTILPLPDSLPMLLMGGTHDGVITNSSDRYGISPGNATSSIIRTFQEAIAKGRNDSYLVILAGANHFSMVETLDPTTARPFLDFPATHPQENFRLLMAEIIGLFIDTHVCQETVAYQRLERLLNTANPLIESFERK